MNGARLRRKAIGFVASLLGCAAAAGGVVAQPLPHARPEAVGFSSPKLKKLDEAMQAMVDQGHVAGAVTLLARHGHIVQTAAFGKRGLETADPMPANAIFRIRSETKPVTGVAMMILYDEGKWKLDDPVSKYVPEFANLRVVKMDPEGRPILTPISRPPTMRELMTHTAGFAYGIADDPSSPADQAYYKAAVLQSGSLNELVSKVSTLPMFAEPGTLWRYSVAADIQGYIVEKLSGQSLPVFMQERIFAPLGMGDTAFYVPQEKVGRLAALYDADSAGRLIPAVEGAWRDVTKPPLAPSGGGGLVSTAHDFARFAQMILNGGELDGTRILQPETVALMRLNQLPASFTVTTNGTAGVLQPTANAKPFPFALGMGYGLDVAVAVDPAASGAPVGPGTISWGGSAGTWFWIDPANDLFFIGMIQRLGGVGSGLDATTRTLVYQALEHPEQ
ncbi:serine hydrolase domain-containing protein [Caulobacter sp.]|uniref:serine hydrolase domain-containing protein n=1 Tax=Caulobacter sp. TaxID=78 RepID=UPI003BA8F8E8